MSNSDGYWDRWKQWKAPHWGFKPIRFRYYAPYRRTEDGLTVCVDCGFPWEKATIDWAPARWAPTCTCSREKPS